jgi:hypothetical protein
MFVIAVSNGTVIPSIGHVIHHTVGIDWGSVIHVPRTKYIIWVKNVYDPSAMRKIAVIVIYNVKPANPNNASVVVLDFNIAGLDYPTVIVIINGNIFNLDYRTIIIILNIGIIVITRIETYIYIGSIDGYIRPFLGANIDKVELAVGKNGEFHIAFHKNVGVSIITASVMVFTVVWSCLCGKAKQQDTENKS